MKIEALTLFEVLSLSVTLIGLGVIAWNLALLMRQTKLLSESLRAATFAPLDAQQFEITRLLIEHPSLRDYIYRQADPAASVPRSARGPKRSPSTCSTSLPPS